MSKYTCIRTLTFFTGKDKKKKRVEAGTPFDGKLLSKATKHLYLKFKLIAEVVVKNDEK
jgi:hypothetical protein